MKTLFTILLFATAFTGLLAENTQDDRMNKLQEAIVWGDASTVRLSIDQGMNISTRFSDRNTPTATDTPKVGTLWTSRNSDFVQELIIDLGSVQNITAIAIQGRPDVVKYVEEFTISYGYNGLDYTDFKEPNGNIKIFKGNVGNDSIEYNVFEVPIIAQWIRINPTRWRDRIPLEDESYVSHVLYFDGSSLTRLDLLSNPIASLYESIRFRFKTTYANGIILYSRGTQGGYIALQLKDDRVILNIDLGSGLMTTLSVESLLDDNVWHDVIISRNQRDIIFSVDRVIVRGRIKGEFNRLNLNRAIYIGGVPNIQEGMVVQQNYTGCVKDLYFNSSNFIREMKNAHETGQSLRYQNINVLYSCPDVPITFLTRSSYVKIMGYEGLKQLYVSFDFRTHEDHGLMVYHEFTSRGYLKIYLEYGKVKIDIKTNDGTKITIDNYVEQFNDGRWHSLVLTISNNNLLLYIDQRPSLTTRSLDMTTGGVYFIGGDGNKGDDGFVGCMRIITIDGYYKPPSDWKKKNYCCNGEIVFDACHMIDRCNPNPCQHSGICQQDSREFFCDCSNTGYGGAVCHTPLNPLSCQAFKNVRSVQARENIHIDIDGSGPLDPFPVTCEFYANDRIVTVLGHSKENTISVDGFQEPGSFEQNIIYKANLPQIEALLNRSSNCWQRLSYQCRSSRLFNSSSDEQAFQPYSWWISRQNRRMDYWAGGLPGSRKCECGIQGNCIDPTKWCNCDANSPEWQEDSGEIREKENLPVMAVRFGDTGTPLDEKQGRYTLGPLMCEGDDLFNNVVTFSVAEATINLPPINTGDLGDIYFEFMTVMKDAIFIHAKGPTDYIKLSIIGGKKIQFEYQAGSGPLEVHVETSYHLNDNQWHSVSVERNRKETRLIVDGLRAQARRSSVSVRAFHLTSEMVIGAAIDYRDGFIGCMRAFLINGQLIDLKSYAERDLYGVSTDCIGISTPQRFNCDSSPCLNNGTCFERDDGYTCDCQWTAFKGPICADEIGVNLRASSSVKYDFLGSSRSTIAEHIRVGFTTTNPQGFLLGLSSDISGEYLTIMISKSGRLHVVFDFGFERQELIYPNVHFGTGQFHDVQFSRMNFGSTVVLTVDNYEPHQYHFDIKASVDAQFNNIQYMYIGKNESMSDGFIGCVSRVEFDDIYPLKLLFQETESPNVRSIGNPLTEDFCGVEPVTHPPIEIETRPAPLIDEQNAYLHVDSSLLKDKLNVVRILIEHGADVNVKENRENMPLYWSADYDHADVVRVLIEKLADINADGGNTPQKIATGTTDATQILQEADEKPAERKSHLLAIGYNIISFLCKTLKKLL